MLWGWEGFFSSFLFVVSISSMSILSFILWSCWFLEIFPIWCGKFVSWNLWNKNGCFGYWIWFMWSLIGGPNVVDAELCIRFDFFCMGHKDRNWFTCGCLVSGSSSGLSSLALLF